MPTLIEMIVPKDFEYYSFGNSRLNKNKELEIGHEKLMDKSGNEESDSKDKLKIKEAKRKYVSLIGFAWQYLMKENRVE